MADYSIRNCKNCGVPFQPKKHDNVFCSRKCAVAHFNKLRRKPTLPARECPVCHRLFTPKNKINRYCSKECNVKRYLLRENKGYKEKACLNCDRIFKPYYGSQVLCKECMGVVKRERKPKKPKTVAEKTPMPKPEFTLNEYYCYHCKRKVHAKIKENAGCCQFCGDLVFSTGASDVQNYQLYIKNMGLKGG